MKKLVVSTVFGVMLFGVACAEGLPTEATNWFTDDLLKFAVSMIASFVAGALVALGFRKK